MDRRSIFLHRLVVVMSEGGTRRGRPADRLDMVRGRLEGALVGKSARAMTKSRTKRWATSAMWLSSCRQEKPRSQTIGRPYRRPTQVGGGKCLKVNE